MTVENGASMDLTNLFKSCVKTIRTRNKAMGVTLPQTKIFPSSPTAFSQFYSKAKDIHSNISSHRNLLDDHRKKYLQIEDQSMSDYERTYMEKVVTTNLRIIDDNIRALEMTEKCSKDASDCQQTILSILKQNFQQINSGFKDMKEARCKKQKEKENLSRLQRPAGSKKKSKDHGSDTLDGSMSGSWSQSSDSQHTDQRNLEDQHLDENRLKGSENKAGNSSTATDRSSAVIEEEVEKMLGELSSEERQMLEEENAHLYKELMSNQEEVRQITRQVVELGQMQNMLTENVDIQAHQIEEIHDTILTATENVREGNEQVREAMRKDAGFRVWIMFFLIVMSCTILFLDWYNS
ncbi:syntaxin-18-like [Penaeus chinensis]|uniref:syntaxin-18-like n=1 Tax=Penaeus chinensis TaxID=139456 RepID=UPI001FB7095D|nr:syntaxin-18-like [Penaeus chinensis]XP_047501739.1 syntaxin-18-like [Penaeus chinensis]